MDKTKKLKNIILNKYSSIREFARVAEIPSTTLTSALDKDIGGMAVDRVIKICEILNIDIKTFDPIESNIDSTDQHHIDMNNENSTMRDIMNRIKNRRSELNMSYQELATKTNITKSTLQRYETGSIKNMPLDKLELVANALDISPAYLMGWEDIEEKENTISIKDRKLLSNFNKLNETGKDEAIKRVSELTLIPSYTEEPEDMSIKTIAAHNDHLTEHGEMDKIMQDIEDMKKW